jgi:hypothetical protein
MHSALEHQPPLHTSNKCSQMQCSWLLCPAPQEQCDLIHCVTILTIWKKLPFTSSNDEICTKLFPTETGAGSDTGMLTSSYCLQSVLLTSEDSIILTPATNPVGRPFWTQISITQWQKPGACYQELYIHYILIYLTCCSNVSYNHAKCVSRHHQFKRNDLHTFPYVQNVRTFEYSVCWIYFGLIYAQLPPIYIKNISSSGNQHI